MGLHLCRNRCAGGGRKEVLDSVALAQQVIPLQCLALSRVANSSQGFRCRGQRAAACDVWQCPGGEFPVPNPSVYASSEIDGNQDTAQQQGGPTERPQRAGQQANHGKCSRVSPFMLRFMNSLHCSIAFRDRMTSNCSWPARESSIQCAQSWSPRLHTLRPP